MTRYHPRHAAASGLLRSGPASDAVTHSRRKLGPAIALGIAALAAISAAVLAPGLVGSAGQGGNSAESDAETPSGPLMPDAAPDPLSWSPPELTDPVTVLIGDDWVYELNERRDYRLVFPARPVMHPVVISGGHNIVMIGGEIRIPDQGPAPSIRERRGLFLRKQTGVVHVEGLLITGEDLSEGIQIDAPEAIVQLRNLRVERVRARDQVEFTDNHPDILQPWGGVKELRVDGLTGRSDYQGLFLKSDFEPIGSVVLRRVNIEGDPTARYLFWTSGDFELTLDRVFVSPAPGRALSKTLWPDMAAWSGIQVGLPPAGDFVPADLVGVGYERRLGLDG